MLVKSVVALICVLVAASAGLQPAGAQSYPVKPIRIISPYPPGGSTDITARLLAPKLSASLGQPVLVENRAGAGGAIGAEAVARSAPDGYTLLLTSSATLTSALITTRKLAFDPINDFTPISAVVTQPGIMLVNTSFPAASFEEVIRYAKANPGKLSYGTTGIGSSFHFMGEIIKLTAAISMEHVPYKGGAQVAQAIASGEVPLALVSNTSGMAAVKSGKAKAIAVVADKPHEQLPGVPAISQLLPGVQRPADWLGIYGPAGMSGPLLARLHQEIVKALHAPDVVARLQAAGMDPYGNTPEEFAAQIRRDMDLMRKMVALVGIKLE